MHARATSTTTDDHDHDQPMVILVNVPRAQGVQVVQALDEGTAVLMTADGAQARVLLERHLGGVPDDHRRVVLDRLEIDLDARSARWDGTPLDLVGRELDVLAYLAEDAGRVRGARELTERVWQRAYVGDSAAVSSTVKRLRAHLRAAGAEVLVETVRGRGYRIALPD